MRTRFVAGLAALTVLGSPAAYADTATPTADDPPHIIGLPRYTGTGCPPGSLTADLTTDGRTLTLAYQKFNARIGPDVPRDEARKKCSVAVDLHAPAGWRFVLAGDIQRGFVDLDQGVTASSASNAWWEGAQPTSYIGQAVSGPRREDYLRDHQFAPGEEPVAPCGVDATLNATGTIALISPNRTRKGYMGGDPEDGTSVTSYELFLRKCPAS